MGFAPFFRISISLSNAGTYVPSDWRQSYEQHEIHNVDSIIREEIKRSSAASPAVNDRARNNTSGIWFFPTRLPRSNRAEDSLCKLLFLRYAARHYLRILDLATSYSLYSAMRVATTAAGTSQFAIRALSAGCSQASTPHQRIKRSPVSATQILIRSSQSTNKLFAYYIVPVSGQRSEIQIARGYSVRLTVLTARRA